MSPLPQPDNLLILDQADDAPLKLADWGFSTVSGGAGGPRCQGWGAGSTLGAERGDRVDQEPFGSNPLPSCSSLWGQID